MINLAHIRDMITRKRISLTLIFTLILNIIAPSLTYAIAPSFDSNLVTSNVVPIAQVNEIIVPRDLVAGDVLDISIAGTNVSQSFDTTSDITLQQLNVKINSLVGEVVSVFNSGTKKFTITAKVPGVAFPIGDLTITRTPVTPIITIPNIVAVAQQSNINVSQNLFEGDTIVLNISGTGVIESFSGSKDETLQALADQITLMTNASGSYDNAGTINLIAKTPGIGFGISDLNITSNGISVVNQTPNIVPVAQVERISIPRVIYPDETITLTVNSSGITQSYIGSSNNTISELSEQIDALPDVSSTASGNDISVTSEIPGTAFTISNIDITGGTVNSINAIPNVDAVAQVNYITSPRNLYIGDRINFGVNGVDASQGFNGTSNNTLTILNSNISAIPNVTSILNLLTKTITITSTVPGTPFTASGLYITTELNSSGITANVIAQEQESEIVFNREFVTGDTISLVVNGNTITQNFSSTSDDTLNELAAKIGSGTLNITVTPDTAANSIDLESDTAGISFNVSNISILNSIFPTVTQESSKPVKQRNIFSIPQDLLPGDNIALNVDGTDISQIYDTDGPTTLDELNQKINAIASVNSSLSSNTFTVDATNSGTAFTISSVSISGSSFTGNNLTGNVPEIKASLSLNVESIPADATNIIVGNCTINFDSGAIIDTDCSDGAASLDSTGISSTSLFAALLRGISGVSDDDNGVLTIGGAGTVATYTTSGDQDNLSDIDFNDGTLSAIDGTLTSPQLAIAQVDEIVMSRDFVPGDTFSITVDGIPVQQNFVSDNATSLTNLNATLNSLPSITSTLDIPSRTFTLTAQNPGISFVLGAGLFSDTQNSALTISNFVGATQISQIVIPSNFVAGDSIEVVINGITSTGSFASDSATTINNLISGINTNVSSVNATLGGPLTISIESDNAGDSFTIDKTEITNITVPTSVNPNIAGAAQVDTLTIPYALTSSDSISVRINGNVIDQAFTTDAETTLSLLNTQISNLPEVSSIVNTGSEMFTISSKIAGTPFTASIVGTGITINSVNTTPNVESGSQVDTLTVNRVLTADDTLTLDIAGNILTQAYSGSAGGTLQSLSDQIDALAEVSSIFDSGEQAFTITSEVPGTPFVSGILTIANQTNSVNLTPNVVAQAQVDKITLPRNIISGDRLRVTINGTSITEDFSGSIASTLDSFESRINSTATGTNMNVSGNELIFTATTAGIPFTINSFSILNTTSPTTTVDNVVAVKQETQINVPNFVAGDMISLSIDGNPASQGFDTDNSTTANELIEDINLIGLVDASYDTNVITLVSKIAGTPFNTSIVSIVNSTTPILVTPNVLPVAQVVDMTPNGTFRAGLTFRAVINGAQNDYLTMNGDSAAEIVNGLADAIIANINTGVTVSTGSNVLTLTASTPGISFTYQSSVLDITAPIVSSSISTAQTLKSGSISTSTVSIDEDGDIYLVLSGTTASTVAELLQTVSSSSGFIIGGVIKDANHTVTVPSGVKDGLYNVIGVDPSDNVSQVFPGWLTVDNTAPIVSITTPAQTISPNTINISGTTEPNTNVSIDNSGAVVNTVSDGSGDFSETVSLNLDTQNNILVSATDIAGNIGTGSVIITNDTLSPNPFVINAPTYSNSGTANIGVQTEPSTLTEVFSGATLISSGTTDSSGSIDFAIPLNTNAVNNFHVISTDIAGNTNSGNVVIIEDSISPNVILDPLPSIINADFIDINGTTDPDSSVGVYQSGALVGTGTASSTGGFSITVPLIPNNVNSFDVAATDLATNTGTPSNVSIIEDSIPNALIIGTPQFITSQSSIFLTGSTKPNSTIQITGGQSLESGSADSSGNFSVSVSLNQNALNDLSVTSTDQVGFVATGSIGITNDNVNPTVAISTQSQTTNSQIINIDGTTEADSTIVITGGSGTFFGVSDSSGSFSVPVLLNQDLENNLTVTATDMAGNNGTGNISITHDSIVIFLNLNIPNSYTADSTFTFTGTTKKNANVTVTGGSTGAINTSGDPLTGDFTITVPLNLNSVNNIVVTTTDATTLSTTGGFIITQDNTPPSLTVNSLPASVNTSNIILTGATESGAIVTFSNGVSSISSTADSSGNYSLTFPLILNSSNSLTGSSIDQAGNSFSGANFNIINDNLGPVIANLEASPTVPSSIMHIDYSFNTNENSTSTFYVGTGSNVLSTVIASGTTSGTGHLSIIPGLIPNQSYYYFIESVDNLGNISDSQVYALNSADTVGPQIFGLNISNITSSGAILDFLFKDASFHQNNFATGTLNFTDGTSTFNKVPQLTFGNIINNTGTAVLNSLLSGTRYFYNLIMKDDFGNLSSVSGSFDTAANVILNSTGVIVETGSVAIDLSGSLNNILNLNGNSLIINSDSGALTIPENTTILYSTGWNGVISSPVLVDENLSQSASNLELAGLISTFNIPTTSYNGTILSTISAGGNVSLEISSGYFNLSFDVQNGAPGDIINLFRSSDGNTWQINTPDTTCTLNNQKICSFRTNHLSYFASVKLTGTRVSSSGGGGGNIVPQDYCKDGDYTKSYYDGECGVKPGNNSSSISNPLPASSITPAVSSKIIHINIPKNKKKISNQNSKISQNKNVNKDSNQNTSEKEVSDFKIFKYINVSKSYAVRNNDSFNAKIIKYLPKDYKVELLEEKSNGWSKVFFNGINGFIRSKYLRDANPTERNKNLPTEIFYKINSQTIVDSKRIRVAKSIFARSEPDIKSKIKATLYNNQKVNILETIGDYSKISWDDGSTGYIKTKFISD